MLKYIFLAKCIFITSFLQARINQPEFAARRTKLMDSVKDGIIILKGATEITRNGDVEYPFRQNSYFYYLSGFDEPDAAMILLPGERKFILFVKKLDPKKALWTGTNYGAQEAKDTFSADSVIVNDLFNESLKVFLKNRQKVYMLKDDTKLNNLVTEIMAIDTLQYQAKIEPLDSTLNMLRLIKSPCEIETMQKAADITSDALHASFKYAEPGKYEYELKAIIQYRYLMNNSPRAGFPSIVASGPNATILHYNNYNRQIEDGDLILLDIGAEYGMYTADISRTIPANGCFSDKQTEIYQIVLQAQKAAIDSCRPGIGLKEIAAISRDIIRDGLFKLGLITDKESLWQTHVWLMHGISHWLGLDVHDAGSYNYRSEKGEILEPGMVFTVEPGIYISQLAFDSIEDIFGKTVSSDEISVFKKAVKPAFEKYKDIGVRIEDDILITENGCNILSKNAAKEIEAIEKIMADN